MNSVLDRKSHDPLRTELRRLIVAGFVVVLASVCWHAVRSLLIYPAACSSVGHPGRGALILAALRQRTPEFPPNDSLARYGSGPLPYVASYNTPEPGWVMWGVAREWGPGGPNWGRPEQATTYFADERLRVRGALSHMGWPNTAPCDVDRDGQWEVVRDYEACPSDPTFKRFVTGWVVIRLGRTDDEIVWAGASGLTVWPDGGERIDPLWRDEDGDGMQELLFVTVASVKLPNGEIGFQPPRTVAVYAWDRPGGVLRPRMLPESGFLSWSPPEGRPVKIRIDEEPTAIVCKEFPIPDSFGYGNNPATQPPAVPQTQPLTLPR